MTRRKEDGSHHKLAKGYGTRIENGSSEKLVKKYKKREKIFEEFFYRFWKPIFDKNGDVDLVLTKTREERVQMFTEGLIKIREESGGIKEVKFAAGGDDGDLDELADALLLSGTLFGDDVVKKVKISSTPIGAAPKRFRDAWKGIELVGMMIPATKDLETDLVTGMPIPPRNHFAVYAPYAINKLSGSSPQAAKWFDKNFPGNIQMLSFGANEVEVVS